jgi:hypothetical protein
LQLRVFARGLYSNATDFLFMRFNGDTGTSYPWHVLNGNGSAASSTGSTTNTYIKLSTVTSATATANIFGVAIVDVLDYTNTNKFKTVRAIGGYDANGLGEVSLNSGYFPSTSTVNSITIDTAFNTSNTSSVFCLYGITSSQVTGA